MNDPGKVWPRGSLGYLLLGGVVGSVLLCALAMIEIVQDRQRALETAQRSVENIVELLSARMEQTFRAIDQSLLGLSGIIDIGALDDTEQRRQAHEILNERLRLIDGALSVFVLDADGQAVLSSRTEVPESIDLSDRDYYQVHRDARTYSVFFSAPATGRVGYAQDRQILTASHALRHADGSLAGVIAVVVSIEYLSREVFARIDVGADGAVALLRSNGTTIAQHPFVRTLIGTDVVDVGESGNLDAPSGIYRGEWPGDRIERVGAYAHLRDHPFLVLAGLSEGEVLESWSGQALQMAGIAALLSLLLVGSAVVGGRKIHSQEREAVRYARSLQRLTDASRSIVARDDVDELLQEVIDLARDLIGAHQGAASRTQDRSFGQRISAVSLSEDYAEWHDYDESPDGSGIYSEVCRTNQPMRLTQEVLKAHRAWRGFGASRDRHPPLVGWLAAPLVGRDGVNLGLIQLSHKEDGDFTANDEALLVQIANIAAVAIENVEAAANRQRALEAEYLAREEAEILRVQAEAAVRSEAETRRWLETLLASITDAFYVLDLQWRFTFVNERARRLVDEPNMIGQCIWDLWPDLHGSEIKACYELAVAQGEPISHTYWSDRVGEWLEVHAYPFEQGLTVYVRVVTDRIEMEGQLRQAQKLEAVGQITGGVAHDFNNLLTVILGNSDIIQAEATGNPTLERAAALSVSAAERAADLTQRLLAFARRQPLEPGPVSVNQLVRNLDDMLRRTIGEQIEIELVTGAGAWPAFVDGSQLETAILNLAINARDAMPDGGWLTIETANTAIDAEYAEQHSEVTPGQYLLVAVSDTGSGMASDIADKAFDPFFTTKPQGRGSGLGLSMVYGFIKQSGGHIKIYSEPEQGTTVRMYLPRAQAPSTQGAEIETLPEPLPGAGERVLVVEDEELVRNFFATTLDALGYSVVAVSDGPAALAAATGPGQFDILLTDIVLPGGMNGRQVADRIVAIDPGIAVLFTSGYTENAIVHHGRLDPGIDLLQKPFRKHEIARKMRQALERRQQPG